MLGLSQVFSFLLPHVRARVCTQYTHNEDSYCCKEDAGLSEATCSDHMGRNGANVLACIPGHLCWRNILRFPGDCGSAIELCGLFLSQAIEKAYAVDCFEQICVAILQAFGQRFSSRKLFKATHPCTEQRVPCFPSSPVAMETLVNTRNPKLLSRSANPAPGNLWHLRCGL